MPRYSNPCAAPAGQYAAADDQQGCTGIHPEQIKLGSVQTEQIFQWRRQNPAACQQQ